MYWAECLPPFDFQGVTKSGLYLSTKTDAYISIQLGADRYRTGFKTVYLIHGTHHCEDADFFEEISIPYFHPTAFKFIQIQVYDQVCIYAYFQFLQLTIPNPKLTFLPQIGPWIWHGSVNWELFSSSSCRYTRQETKERATKTISRPALVSSS